MAISQAEEQYVRELERRIEDSGNGDLIHVVRGVSHEVQGSSTSHDEEYAKALERRLIQPDPSNPVSVNRGVGTRDGDEARLPSVYHADAQVPTGSDPIVHDPMGHELRKSLAKAHSQASDRRAHVGDEHAVQPVITPVGHIVPGFGEDGVLMADQVVGAVGARQPAVVMATSDTAQSALYEEAKAAHEARVAKAAELGKEQPTTTEEATVDEDGVVINRENKKVHRTATSEQKDREVKTGAKKHKDGEAPESVSAEDADHVKGQE